MEKEKRKWCVMFSQTGSEIAALSQRLGRVPDAVITNNSDIANFSILSEKYDLYILPDRPKLCEYETILDQFEIPLITLHGYLRIIPKEICEKYQIVNGHPGLITTYPELKGFNPQERAVNYDTIGCVLHKVTAGVDEGEVISSKEIKNVWRHKPGVIAALKKVQFELWENWLQDNL